MLYGIRNTCQLVVKLNVCVANVQLAVPVVPFKVHTCVVAASALAATTQVPEPTGNPLPKIKLFATPRTFQTPDESQAPPTAFTYDCVTGASASFPNKLPAATLSPDAEYKSSAEKNKSFRLVNP